MEGAGGAAERRPTVDECAGRLQVTICRQARSFANGCRETEKRERVDREGGKVRGKGFLTLSGRYLSRKKEGRIDGIDMVFIRDPDSTCIKQTRAQHLALHRVLKPS